MSILNKQTKDPLRLHSKEVEHYIFSFCWFYDYNVVDEGMEMKGGSSECTYTFCTEIKSNMPQT